MIKRFGPAVLYLMLMVAIFSCSDGMEYESPNVCWKANTLTKMQLRGSVKKFVMNSTEYQFNRDGFVTSMTDRSTPTEDRTEYEYANGRLVTKRAIYYTYGQTDTLTTTYEYNNPGKFIPIDPANLYQAGLVEGLSAVVTGGKRVEYVFKGSEMTVTPLPKMFDFTYTYIFKFEGGYPVTCSSSKGKSEITYSSNGMFRSITDVRDNGIFVYSFIPNTRSVLLDKITQTLESVPLTATTKYSYNFYQNIVSETATTVYANQPSNSTIEYSNKFSNYVYDSKGNWIRRQASYLSGNAWVDYEPEQRVIEYY